MSEPLYYDLHLHSCLSPCGDNDMTPANIAGMAALKGLDVIALTDHNSCGNCAALMQAARAVSPSLLVLPGMELCTAEEIHVVCLFTALSDALAFDTCVAARSPFIENRPDIYGEQRYMDARDGVCGEEPRLLVAASSLPLLSVQALVAQHRGLCFPAHVDRHSYSALSCLGEFPPELSMPLAEVADPASLPALRAEHAFLRERRTITNSDAHYLWDIHERLYAIQAPRDPAGFLAALAARPDD